MNNSLQKQEVKSVSPAIFQGIETEIAPFCHSLSLVAACFCSIIFTNPVNAAANQAAPAIEDQPVAVPSSAPPAHGTAWKRELLTENYIADARLSPPEAPADQQNLPADTSDSIAEEEPVGWQQDLLKDSYVEGGIKYYNLTDGQPDTKGLYLKTFYNPGGSNAWYGEVITLDRFDDTGAYFQAGNRHIFNDYWYSSVFVGTSAGGFYWPRVNVDASLSRKWLSDLSLITTAGIGYFDAKDEHSDISFFLEGTYFFSSPWVIQGGVRRNISSPGSIGSTSGYAALTYLRDKYRIVVLRYGTGHQAYTAIAPNLSIVDFPFHDVTLTWREWVGSDWGFNLIVGNYFSEVYNQHGFELGIFKDF